MKRLGKIAAGVIAAIPAFLAGCASQPPIPQYVVPDDAVTANLTSEILGADSRNESIAVYVLDGRCGDAQRKKLFYVRESKSEPAGYLKVPANQPLRLEYAEDASGGRTCNIALDVNLEAGKSYSLVGGFAYKSGLIPIITGTRMCKFGVQDDADKSPVPYTSTCPQ